MDIKVNDPGPSSESNTQNGYQKWLQEMRSLSLAVDNTSNGSLPQGFYDESLVLQLQNRPGNNRPTSYNQIFFEGPRQFAFPGHEVGHGFVDAINIPPPPVSRLGPAVDLSDFPIETSPFENLAIGGSIGARPASALEQGKISEIRLPGDLVASIPTEELPKKLDSLETEFRTEQLGTLIEAAANDRSKSPTERAEWQKLHDHFRSLDGAGRAEAKAELFAKLRVDMGVETNAETARSSRGARLLNNGAIALSLGIVATAALRVAMVPHHGTTGGDQRIRVRFGS